MFLIFSLKVNELNFYISKTFLEARLSKCCIYFLKNYDDELPHNYDDEKLWTSTLGWCHKLFWRMKRNFYKFIRYTAQIGAEKK